MGAHVTHATLDPEGAPAVRTRLIALAVTLAAAGGLSGCGSELSPDVHPGRAAVVDGQDVSFEQVDELSDQFCEWQRPVLESRKVSLPMSYIRTVAVDSFVDDIVLRAWADEQGLDSEEALKVAEERAESFADEQRAGQGAELGDDVVDLLTRFEYQFLILEYAGRAEVGAQAEPAAAAAAGAKVIEEFREDLDVSVDPRFGSADPQTGAFTAPAGLLSVSGGGGLADVANPEEFDQDYVGSLPASQRCG